MALQIISTILIAIALAIDAFSVSLTKGFTQNHLKTKEILIYALSFGFFQFIMPVLGYFCGGIISKLIIIYCTNYSIYSSFSHRIKYAKGKLW